MTSESNLSGLVKILHFKLSKYLEVVEWDWNLYLSLTRLGSSSLPMSPHHSLCFLQNIRYLNTGSQLRFERHPSVYKLYFKCVWQVSEIIADNARSYGQPRYFLPNHTPLATLACSNQLTPHMFLYVLMRVSQIWVVSVSEYLAPESACTGCQRDMPGLGRNNFRDCRVIKTLGKSFEHHTSKTYTKRKILI